jgi:hypothetical protein
VLQIPIAPRTRFNVIDVALQQVACDIGDQWFESKSLPPVYLIRLDHGALAGAGNDMLGVILLSEEAANRHPQGGGDTMHHLERRVCPAVLYLGQDGLGAAGGFRDLLQGRRVQKPRVPNLRSDADFSAKSV